MSGKKDHVFAADLTELARDDGGRTELRHVRRHVLASYLPDVTAVWTRQQEPRALVVVILYNASK